jgi:hypothetical protein
VLRCRLHDGQDPEDVLVRNSLVEEVGHAVHEDEVAPLPAQREIEGVRYETEVESLLEGEVAGFKEVPEPIPMRNSRNATVYYLFFASQNATGAKIARQILKSYAEHLRS